MSECMMFPKNWEKFIEDYSFEDREEVYTNGTNLVPVFRVEQMVEHYFNNAWIPVSERLPENGLVKDSEVKLIKVLGFYKTSMGVPVIRTQIRQKGRRYNRDRWSWVKTDPITHWMPLPEPPKED